MLKSSLLFKKNSNFTLRGFYMKPSISWNFQICISIPLKTQFKIEFLLLFTGSRNVLEKMPECLKHSLMESQLILLSLLRVMSIMSPIIQSDRSEYICSGVFVLLSLGFFKSRIPGWHSKLLISPIDLHLVCNQYM